MNMRAAPDDFGNSVSGNQQADALRNSEIRFLDRLQREVSDFTAKLTGGKTPADFANVSAGQLNADNLDPWSQRFVKNLVQFWALLASRKAQIQTPTNYSVPDAIKAYSDLLMLSQQQPEMLRDFSNEAANESDPQEKLNKTQLLNLLSLKYGILNVLLTNPPRLYPLEISNAQANTGTQKPSDAAAPADDVAPIENPGAQQPEELSYLDQLSGIVGQQREALHSESTPVVGALDINNPDHWPYLYARGLDRLAKMIAERNAKVVDLKAKGRDVSEGRKKFLDQVEGWFALHDQFLKTHQYKAQSAGVGELKAAQNNWNALYNYTGDLYKKTHPIISAIQQLPVHANSGQRPETSHGDGSPNAANSNDSASADRRQVEKRYLKVMLELLAANIKGLNAGSSQDVQFAHQLEYFRQLVDFRYQIVSNDKKPYDQNEERRSYTILMDWLKKSCRAITEAENRVNLLPKKDASDDVKAKARAVLNSYKTMLSALAQPMLDSGIDHTGSAVAPLAVSSDNQGQVPGSSAVALGNNLRTTPAGLPTAGVGSSATLSSSVVPPTGTLPTASSGVARTFSKVGGYVLPYAVGFTATTILRATFTAAAMMVGVPAVAAVPAIAIAAAVGGRLARDKYVHWKDCRAADQAGKPRPLFNWKASVKKGVIGGVIGAGIGTLLNYGFEQFNDYLGHAAHDASPAPALDASAAAPLPVPTPAPVPAAAPPVTAPPPVVDPLEPILAEFQQHVDAGDFNGITENGMDVKAQIVQALHDKNYDVLKWRGGGAGFEKLNISKDAVSHHLGAKFYDLAYRLAKAVGHDDFVTRSLTRSEEFLRTTTYAADLKL